MFDDFSVHLREEPTDDLTQDSVKLRDGLSGECALIIFAFHLRVLYTHT